MTPPEIHAFLAENHGLITRNQGLALGLHEEEIRRLLARNVWVTVRRGVYTDRATWDSWGTFVDQPLAVVRAAHTTMATDHVLSHHSAGLAHGLPMLDGHRQLVHITRPDVRGSRTRHGVKHHGAVYRDEQVQVVAGLPVLDLARTAVDIAREQGFGGGVVACDAALRRGVSRAELVRACAPMAYWPRIRTVRRCVDFADAGAESVAESLGRILVAELGVGPVQTQFVLDDGQRWVSCDLRVGRHVFEIDGRLKLRRVEDGGVAEGDPEEVLWREKGRQDFVSGFHLGVSRIVWADYWGPRREAAKRRLHREYAATVARFGTDISDLAPYIGRRRVA